MSRVAVKTPGPGVLFTVLLLGGAGVTGWLYGLHWKRIATGNQFTKQEDVLLRLYDQVDLLTEENRKLARELSELERERAGEEDPAVKYAAPEPPAVERDSSAAGGGEDP